MNYNTALEKLKERLPKDIADLDKEKTLHVNNINRLQKDYHPEKKRKE